MNVQIVVDRHVEKLGKVIISTDARHREVQIQRLRASLERQLQAEGHVTYVMPAFPVKSPNPRQVIDTDRADQAEYVALRTLASLLDEYTHIVIATDGEVFLDLLNVSHGGQSIGFRQDAITKFLRGLLEMAEEIARDCPGFCEHLRFVSLGELLERDERSAREYVREEEERRTPTVKMDSHIRFVYKGIRFTVDRCFGSLLSQMDADQAESLRHQLALGVIVRSAIHGELISRRYSGAVRLSVHAQLGADKLGVSLIPGTRVVPWNGVLVEDADGSLKVASREIVPDEQFAMVGEVISPNRSSCYFRARALIDSGVPSTVFYTTSPSDSGGTF